MIFEGSRYEDADVVPTEGADGVYRATIFPTRTVAPPTAFTRHRVVQGDRLDVLAETAYADPELWWVIADANPELLDPDDLKPGTVIRVPVTQ